MGPRLTTGTSQSREDSPPKLKLARFLQESWEVDVFREFGQFVADPYVKALHVESRPFYKVPHLAIECIRLRRPLVYSLPYLHKWSPKKGMPPCRCSVVPCEHYRHLRLDSDNMVNTKASIRFTVEDDIYGCKVISALKIN